MKNKLIFSSIFLIVLLLGLSTITAANTTTTTSIEKQTIDTTTLQTIDNKEKVIVNDNKEIKSLIKDTTTKEITKHQLYNQKKIKSENKNTYYISTNGNQKNDGLSRDTAWDLDTGFSNIKSYNNSKLIIEEGLYNVTKTLNFDNNNTYYCKIIGEKVQFNGQSCIMNINKNSNIEIENITFSNAYTKDNGGAIKNAGNLTLKNCVFDHNTAFYQKGGAIYNNGSLNITNTIFNDNYAYYGGAIYNDYGKISLDNNTFTLNHVVGNGGAIYNDNYESNTTIYIIGNKFYENTCEYNRGGVLFNNGTTIFSNNYINASKGLNGGSIYNLANITINNNTFTNNSAYHGSVLYNWGNALVINNTIQNNKAENKGGTLFNMNNMSVVNNNILNNSASIASVIYNSLGYMEVINNTILNNRASNIATIYNQAKMIIINNTITDNHAQKGNNIYNAYKTIQHANEDYSDRIRMYFRGNLTLNNNILSNNTPLTNNSTASEIYNQGQLLLNNNTFIHKSNNTHYLLYNHELNTTATVTGGLMILNNNIIQSSNRLVINNGNLTINNTIIKDSTDGIIDNYKNMELYNNKIINNTVKTDNQYIINNYNKSIVNIINNTFINNTNNKDDILFNNITLITFIKNNTFIGNYLKIRYEPFTINDTIYNTINHEINFNFIKDIYDTKINSGNVNIYINNQYYNTFLIRNSTANITIKIKDINDKSKIKYTFLSTDNTFQPLDPIEYNITVIKQKSKIDMNLDSEITPNYPLTIKVTSEDNKTLNGIIILYFNNEKIEVPITNGTTTYNYIPKTTGKTTIKATYTDDEGIYLNSTITKTTTVLKANTTLIVNPLINLTAKVINISIELKDTNNNYLNGSIIIKNSNNTLSIINIINGKGNFSKRFINTFNDNITFIYEGSPIYNPVNTTVNINIHKLNTNIKLNHVNAYIGDKINLKATVTDEDGNPVTEGRLVFKVNGKTIKDTNGNIIYATIKDGIATIENYTVPANWFKIKSVLNVVYGGTSTYEQTRTNNTIPMNITKKTATMTMTTNTTTTKPGQTIKITVKITEKDANVNEGRVLFKVNGKTMRDNEGYIIYHEVKDGLVTIDYTIPENARAQDYTFTCVYGHKLYNRNDVNSTITVVKS